MKFIILFFISIGLYASHLNIAYGSVAMDQFSKKDIMISMDMWIKEILLDTTYTVTLTTYEKSSEMARDFNAGKIDLVLNKPIDSL